MGSCPLPKENVLIVILVNLGEFVQTNIIALYPHKFVDCPLFLVNSCPRGNECSYRHAIKTEDPQEESKEI